RSTSSKKAEHVQRSSGHVTPRESRRVTTPELDGLPEMTYFFSAEPGAKGGPPQSNGLAHSPGPTPPEVSPLTPSSQGSNGSAPASPRHTHKRTLSDPRLNVGMGNVAAITAFLGDEEVSAAKIDAKRAPDKASEVVTGLTSAEGSAPSARPPPPIPRKSSRRQTSPTNMDGDRAQAPATSRPASARTEDSFVTAPDPPLSAFPLPPTASATALPRLDTSSSQNEYARSTSPISQRQIRAIFPPESPTLLATAISSSVAVSPSSPTRPLAQQGPYASSAGRPSPPPSPRSARTTPRPVASQVTRVDSGRVSPVPSELSEQWFRAPQERLGFKTPSPTKKAPGAPWDANDDVVYAGPGPVVNYSRPTTASTLGGIGFGVDVAPDLRDKRDKKSARWSTVGKK
ncbi:MAG: hypothetical protein INR71_06490, partial [Terriglobus roseus]|nr:hypothetical protein [Terriglobus roseus]